MDELFPGVFRDGNDLYTVNAVPGTDVYGETLTEHDGTEYRFWDPDRSKAAAAIAKGLRTFPIDPDDAVLYLGASTGTTVSHLSDVVNEGIIYAVEYAPQVARSLLDLAEARDNIAPVLGDARKPAMYRSLCSAADFIYQDVTQQDQVAILQRNADMFLKDGGHAMLAVKARSIDSARDPADVFDEVESALGETFEVVEKQRLEPFHRDHMFLVLQF